jgi:soluble lytic murein transglycosylase-like protein
MSHAVDGMTLNKRLRHGISILAGAAAIAGLAAPLCAMAETPKVLSAEDAHAYAAAFDDADRGDFIDAQMQTASVQDHSLAGYLSFRELMHPTAHVAAFDELAGWMARFRDLPVAGRIFTLAAKRKPSDAVTVPTPLVELDDSAPPSAPLTRRARQAREAFYAGDVKKALALAPAAGERWIAGLAAYRLKEYDRAQTYFGELAKGGDCDSWLQSAAGYWAARAADAQGDTAAAASFLRVAAHNPETFYGMIAARQVSLAGQVAQQAAAAAPMLIRAAYSATPATPPAAAPEPAMSADLVQFVTADPRAHRAAALAQIGRGTDAIQELRAGLALARTPEERDRWTALTRAMGTSLADRAQAPRAIDLDYPTPALAPKSGFTIDKALVYAIVRQESRFNPMAVSTTGAVGLMQLMPEAAARAAGDDKLKADMSPLFDPAFNLRVGQDYVTWLMERGVGYDLLKTIAAYNGGPGPVQKTAEMLGDDPDSLLLIECLPAAETRNYVEKVLAGYWTYRKLWGEDAKTLDALATGSRVVDARLDLGQPGGSGTQLASQALQIGMR